MQQSNDDETNKNVSGRWTPRGSVNISSWWFMMPAAAAVAINAKRRNKCAIR